jgi:hypothetical protein
MAAITRVEGPMLLANLDRQGTELNFTTTGSSLFYMNFTQFRIGINTETPSEDLAVNGNIAVTTVKIDKFSTITTTQLNQNLTLVANGTGNVVLINANVISGNIDNTQIGTVTPTHATFTRANVITKAELKLANVQNLTGNRIVYTAADNTQLEDSSALQWFSSNNTLVAEKVITQTASFPAITVDDIKVTTIGNNSIVYMAANNNLIGTPTLSYFAGNSLFRVDGNIQMTGQTRNRVIYKNNNDQLVTSDRLTYDGINFSSPYPNSNTIGNLVISAGTISQLATPGVAVQPDLQILAQSKINFGLKTLYGAASPPTGVDPATVSDYVATVAYVQSAIGGAVFSSIEIRQNDTAVVCKDDEFTLQPNVTVTVNGTKNTEFTQGFANIQNISIHDARISSDGGELQLEGANNNRVRILGNSAVAIPSGTVAQRPAIPVKGDLRHNSDYNLLEYHDGVTWSSVAPSVYSQTITPNGITNVFSTQKPGTSETVLVIVNGVVQKPNEAYTLVGTTLTFNEIPEVTDIIEIRYLTYAITYASTPLFVNTPYATFGTSFTTIDSWYLVQWRGVEYSFVFKNPQNSQYATGQIYVMHDDIEPYINVKEYSNGPNPYLTFNCYIDVYGVVNLQVKGASAGNYFKFRATYFSDDTQAYLTWVSAGLLATYTNITRTSINYQLSATNSGANPVTYALYSGSLPPGVSISSSGLISGSTTAVIAQTDYSFTVVASAGGASSVVSGALSIRILPP